MTDSTDAALPGPDLDTTLQVERLVRLFYAQVAQDELLGPIFNGVARVDWNDHIDKLSVFWTRTLFGVGDYLGNPLAKHQAVHEQQAFTADHFERWLWLFFDTVDAGWQGPGARKVKRVALKVARLHSVKLLGSADYLSRVLNELEERVADQESLLRIETKQPAR